MDRAGVDIDTGSWYHYHLGVIRDEIAEDLDPQIRWCRLHHSTGMFDYGIYYGHVTFRFEQLEDLIMFKLVWTPSRS